MWEALTELVRSCSAYYRGKAERIENPKSAPEGCAAWLAGIGAILAVPLAFVAAVIFYAQWEDAHKSLVAVQRPFVLLDHTALNDTFDTTKKAFAIWLTPIWANAGNTPTKNLRIYRSEFSDKPFKISDFRIPKDTSLAAMSLGPRATAQGNSVNMTEAELKAMQDGNLVKYWWGEAIYGDYLSDAPHITTFCVALMNAKITAETSTQLSFTMGLPYCTIGNCTDEECKAQDAQH